MLNPEGRSGRIVLFTGRASRFLAAIFMPPDAEDDVPGRRVTGSVRRPDRTPVVGVAVLAFDRDLGDGEPLGRTVSDADGGFDLRYGVERLRAFEKDSADLIVRGFDAGPNGAGGPFGGPLAESDVLDAAPAEARVDLVVAAQADPGPTEYERLLAAAGGRDLADLDQDAVTALAAETGLDRESLAALVQADRLARETAMAPEVFYGLLRGGLPADLDALLGTPARTLRAKLAAAVSHQIVPVAVGAAAASILQRLSAFRELTSPLRDLAAAIGLDPGMPLFAALAERGLTSLRDVREAGGLADLDDPSARVLEAHAALSILPVGAATAAQLVSAGFSTVEEVSQTTRAAFVTALDGHLSATAAGSVHDAATLQAPYLNGVLNDLRLASSYGGPTASTAMAAALPSSCECRDCDNATSPVAYLADLLTTRWDG